MGCGYPLGRTPCLLCSATRVEDALECSTRLNPSSLGTCGGKERTTYRCEWAVAWLTESTVNKSILGSRLMVPKQTHENLRDQPMHTHTHAAPGWEKFPDATCVAPNKMRRGDRGLLSHYLRLFNHHFCALMNKERVFLGKGIHLSNLQWQETCRYTSERTLALATSKPSLLGCQNNLSRTPLIPCYSPT